MCESIADRPEAGPYDGLWMRGVHADRPEAGPYDGFGCVARMRTAREAGPYDGFMRRDRHHWRSVWAWSIKNPVPCGTGFLSINYCSFFSLGRIATPAPAESIRTAVHRPILLVSPVRGLAEACAVVRIWKVVEAYSPDSVRTLMV